MAMLNNQMVYHIYIYTFINIICDVCMLLCGGSYMVKIKLKVFIDCLSPPQL